MKSITVRQGKTLKQKPFVSNHSPIYGVYEVRVEDFGSLSRISKLKFLSFRHNPNYVRNKGKESEFVKPPFNSKIVRNRYNGVDLSGAGWFSTSTGSDDDRLEAGKRLMFISGDYKTNFIPPSPPLSLEMFKALKQEVVEVENLYNPKVNDIILTHYAAVGTKAWALTKKERHPKLTLKTIWMKNGNNKRNQEDILRILDNYLKQKVPKIEIQRMVRETRKKKKVPLHFF